MGHMKKEEYFAPAVRIVDLHMDQSFCLSGTLDDTYDDPIDWDDETDAAMKKRFLFAAAVAALGATAPLEVE